MKSKAIAINPHDGKESEYCSDWQQNLDLQKEKLLNTERETKYIPYAKFAECLLAVSVTLLVGCHLYQNIPPAILADKNYDRYKEECEVFLERASLAGTTGVATEELARAVNWLKSNSSTQNFEYRDLKASLDYLGGQPENILKPTPIISSIKYKLRSIKLNQL